MPLLVFNIYWHPPPNAIIYLTISELTIMDFFHTTPKEQEYIAPFLSGVLKGYMAGRHGGGSQVVSENCDKGTGNESDYQPTSQSRPHSLAHFTSLSQWDLCTRNKGLWRQRISSPRFQDFMYTVWANHGVVDFCLRFLCFQQPIKAKLNS